MHSVLSTLFGRFLFDAADLTTKAMAMVFPFLFSQCHLFCMTTLLLWTVFFYLLNGCCQFLNFAIFKSCCLSFCGYPLQLGTCILLLKSNFHVLIYFIHNCWCAFLYFLCFHEGSICCSLCYVPSFIEVHSAASFSKIIVQCFQSVLVCFIRNTITNLT